MDSSPARKILTTLSSAECKKLSFDDYNAQMIHYAEIKHKPTLKFIRKHTNKENKENTFNIYRLSGWEPDPFPSGADLIDIYGAENLNKLKNPNSTTGHYAVKKGNIVGLQFFLTINGNPNIKNENGKTPLHCVVCNKDKTPHIRYDQTNETNYYQNNNNTLQLLIKHPKSNIIAQDNEGNTAIHYATSFKLIDHFLTIKNIDLNIKNNQKETPFFYSLHHRGISIQGGWKHDTITYNDYQFERLCDDMRTDINTQNNNGETPLHYLIKNPRITEQQHHHPSFDIGLAPTISYDNNQTKRLLRRSDIDPNKQDNNQESPLHSAVKVNSTTRDYKGERQCYKDYYKASILELRDQIYLENIQLLLDHKNTIIDPKNKQGETPLICAVKAQNIEAIKLLCSYADRDDVPDHKNLNINITDNNGDTPLDHATATNNQKIIDLLIQHGAISRASDHKDAIATNNKVFTAQPEQLSEKNIKNDTTDESFFYKHKKLILTCSTMGLMGILASIMIYLNYR